MRLRKISVKDKKLLDSYLRKRSHGLSPYAFENIIIWKPLFDIEWGLSDGNICLFFSDKIGCFAQLEPLGRKISPDSVRDMFKIMDRRNVNPDFSRVDNVEEANLPVYSGLGLRLSLRSHDYLCSREALANLSGNLYKSKRASFNFFIKNYQYTYLPYCAKYQDECLALFDAWAKQRKTINPDKAYQWMLEDSRKTLGLALENYSSLGLSGRLVLIDNKVRGFTFGFKLNKDTFCVLFEITDLSVKGLAQFIFCQFCREVSEFNYINIMDDSGLENLKKVKLSYHPVKLVPSYTAQKNA